MLPPIPIRTLRQTSTRIFRQILCLLLHWRNRTVPKKPPPPRAITNADQQQQQKQQQNPASLITLLSHWHLLVQQQLHRFPRLPAIREGNL
jgi:hypothetical protein